MSFHSIPFLCSSETMKTQAHVDQAMVSVGTNGRGGESSGTKGELGGLWKGGLGREGGYDRVLRLVTSISPSTFELDFILRGGAVRKRGGDRCLVYVRDGRRKCMRIRLCSCVFPFWGVPPD